MQVVARFTEVYMCGLIIIMHYNNCVLALCILIILQNKMIFKLQWVTVSKIEIIVKYRILAGIRICGIDHGLVRLR